MLAGDSRRGRGCGPSRASTRWRSRGTDALCDGARRGGDHRALDRAASRRRRSGSCARSSTAPARSMSSRSSAATGGGRGRRRRSARAAVFQTGDLGPGSYGHAFRQFHDGLRRRGWGWGWGWGLRPVRASGHQAPRSAGGSHRGGQPVDPQANRRERGVKSRNTIAPCHGWVHALVLGEQAALGAQPTLGRHADRGAVEHGAVHGAGPDAGAADGYRFAEYVHWIQYAHIYVNQLSTCRRCSRASRGDCRRCG